MFTKTICTPGAPIVIVPDGLLAVLRYNKNGQLEGIQLGYDTSNYESVDASTVQAVKETNVAPTDINITAGTTYVYGLFYHEDQDFISGQLPTCLRDYLKMQLSYHPDKFKFLASHLVSMAANFKSALAIRNWLEMNHFNRLPMLIAPSVVNDQNVFELLNKRYKQYRWPLMSGYWIEKSGKQKFIPSGLSQYNVAKVDQKIDGAGIVMGVLHFETNHEDMIIPWSQVLDFDISDDTTIILEDSKIISSMRNSVKMREPRAHKYVCPICGKQQIVEYNQGTVECDDPNCKSKLYSKICQFISVLDLPEMTWEQYKSNINNLTCIADLFTIDPYRDIQISCTISQLLRSVVSPIEVPNAAILQQFADACSNTVKTVDYYIQNPDHIFYDLHLQSNFTTKLVKWLSVPYNALMLHTLLSSTDNIQIVGAGKRFDGAPIFRGKKICITGDFMHGSIADITSILKSYDADVTTSFNDSAHCLIIGGAHANIDGGMIQAAQQTGVPVFEEADFFRKYDIDSDLNANLQ